MHGDQGRHQRVNTRRPFGTEGHKRIDREVTTPSKRGTGGR